MTTFFDDFNRANGAPGANWVDSSGLWTVVSNQLSSGSAGGTIVIRAATAMATSDNSAQVTIAATGAVSHGVWCRGNTGFTNGYLFRNDGTSWVLFSNVGGSFTSLGSFAGAAVAGDVAKVQAVGSTITGYVNGVARVTVTNTAVTTGTSVGIRAESTNLLRFDDFTGADVTSGATGDAALTGTATLSAAGLRATSGAAAQAATAGLSAAGQLAAVGSGSEAATATLTASGTAAVAGSATAPLTAGLSAVGTAGLAGAAQLMGNAGLSADGARATPGDGSRSAVAGLSATGSVARSGSASLVATGALAGAGNAGLVLAAGAAANASLTAAGVAAMFGAASLAASVVLQASGVAAPALVPGTSGPGVAASPSASRGALSAPVASGGTVLVPTASGGVT